MNAKNISKIVVDDGSTDKTLKEIINAKPK